MITGDLVFGWRWLSRRWQRTPDRTEVLRRFAQLKPLPEADRMRTTRPEAPKPKTVAEWKRRFVA